MTQTDNKKPKSDIDEIRDSVKQSILERVSSPLIGSFAISWVIVNWKGISYFLLSKEPIVERLAYIDEKFSGHLLLWIIPLLVSLIYVFGYPWPNRQVVRYRSFMKRRDEEVRLKDEDKLRIAIQKRQNSEEWRAIEKEKEQLKADREELSYNKAHLDEDRNDFENEKAELERDRLSFLKRIANNEEYKALVEGALVEEIPAPEVSSAPKKTSIEETVIGKVTATKRATPENIEYLLNQGYLESDIVTILIDKKLSFQNLKQLHDKIGLENIRWLIKMNEPLNPSLELFNMGLTWDQVVILVESGASLPEARNMLREKMSFENIVRVYKNHNGDSEGSKEP